MERESEQERGLLVENVGRLVLTGQEFCLPEPDKASEQTQAARAGGVSSAADAAVPALAERCAERSLPAFEELFRSLGPKMKSIALNMLGDVAQAEDAVQEAFLKAYRGAENFRGHAAFSTWLYRILMNTCLDARRKRGREPDATDFDTLADAGVQPAARASSHAMRLMLERCVARLPSRQREIFLLFEVEGFRHQEIAAILGISEAASKNTLFEAKRALRRMLRAGRSGEEGNQS
jgi:RNA polymerase sigma-70 factor (ECF subfamily)